MLTSTGKKQRYAEMIALGTVRPSTPRVASTTMIIGAIATIGIVWLMIAQGIRLMFAVFEYTIETAIPIPTVVPSAKPQSVDCNVIQPWKTSERFDVTLVSSTVFFSSAATWCGAGRRGRS